MIRSLAPCVFAAAICALAPAFAQEWTHYGAGPEGRRYVASDQIDRRNVNRLKQAWTYRAGHASASPAAFARARFQATPILVEGKLALCTPFNAVIALDPGNGRELWRYDPRIDLATKPANGFNCRGVSYWRDAQAPSEAQCASRIFMGTNDARVIAVDLADGRPCADFGQNGAVAVDPGMALNRPGEFQITSPPAIVGDLVVVGAAIEDNARREAPRGAVRAYDARTGALAWTWDPIPRDARAPALGWPAAPPEGHANAWAPMAVDAARGLLFVPTTSPSPDFFGGLRAGDNRHANSVVALDAATGAVRWAFQTVHHDVWDYDLPAQPTLATISKDGRRRDVVIQVTKTGLVFVLDRETGEPVFPVDERPVPQDGVEGEKLSPTQPFPIAPAPLTPQRIGPNYAFGLTPFDRDACRRRIAQARSDGIFTPPSTQGTIVFPSTAGGANWGGAAFDAQRNRLYVNTMSLLHIVTLVPRSDGGPDRGRYGDVEFGAMEGTPYAATRDAKILSPLGLPCNPPPWGQIHAIDMDSGAVAWSSPLGTTEDLAPLGIAVKWGTPNLGAPLATGGGLVFIGAAMDRYLRAFDSDTGRELWQGRLPAGGQATPMSYEWEERQYIVIAAGGHGDLGTVQGDSVVAFALPRAGEPGPSIRSYTIDRPGGRFMAGAVGAGIALAILFLLWPRRRSLDD